MISILIILLIISCVGLRKTDNHDTCLNKEYTDAIKGIFIIIVLYSHILPYMETAGVSFSPVLDIPSNTLIHRIGQLMVVMFLFYSGYGVMESIMKKGNEYVRAIPVKRVLSTLVNYAIAVMVFLVMNKLIGIHYPVKQYILSFVAWESVGQSNWYIFAILCCYVSTFVSFTLFSDKKHALYANAFLLLIYIIALYIFKERWWYNTVPAYLAGMIVSLNKKEIFSLLDKSYAGCIIVLTCLFVVCFHFRNLTVFYLILSVLFALLLLVLTDRFVINSRILSWCGKNLFQLYIYQRLPMIALLTLFPQWVRIHPYIYVSGCLAITILMAVLIKPVSITKKTK